MRGGWQYGDGGGWITSQTGLTSCRDCQQFPDDKECGTATELSFHERFFFTLIVLGGGQFTTWLSKSSITQKNAS